MYLIQCVQFSPKYRIQLRWPNWRIRVPAWLAYFCVDFL